MSINKLNEEIKSYYNNDKTNRAFMINGPWGSGKTFYVKNVLSKFLKNNKIDNIFVSLFGISSIQQLSKTVFVESTFTGWKKHLSLGYAIIKNLLINGLEFKGLKLNVSESEIDQIYKKINVKKKLIVFDDLERTNVNLKEVLGYINYLCEFCSAKILVICDEEKIRNQFFLDFKEKVICRTINFIPDFKESISSILNIFSDNLDFKKIINYKSRMNDVSIFEKISLLMQTNNDINLRTLIHSCQVTSNIFSLARQKTRKIFDREFLLQYFLGIYKHFVSLSKNNQGASKDLSNSYKFPLFNSADNYIKNNDFNIDDFLNDEKICMVTNNQVLSDIDISIIYNFLHHSDSEIKNSLNTIYNKLDSPYLVNPSTYVRLIENLLAIKKVSKKLIDDDFINKISNKMIENISNYKYEIQLPDSFSYPINFDFQDKEDREFLVDFQLKMNNVINNSKIDKITRVFLSGEFDNAIKTLEKNINLFMKNNKFLSYFELSIIEKFLIKSSVDQLYRFISVVSNIYDHLTTLIDSEKSTIRQIELSIHSKIKNSEIDEVKKYLLTHYLQKSLEKFITLFTKDNIKNI